MRYRPEIDGLRAIAVLPVMLFHAGAAGFAGGFVGVDVFFVISGFLITSIVREQLAEGRFSIARFYERRVRRLLPALLTMSITIVAAGWWIMGPSEFHALSGSVTAVSLFGSNMWFWADSGYFAAPAETTPMLHTWSLGVEEQFYLLFPPLLILLARARRDRTMLALGVVIATSLTASVAVAPRDPDAAFYWLPMRAWELGVGAALALWAAQRPERSRPRWEELATVAGLVAIAVAVVFLDRGVVAGGYWALLPVLGSTLVLAFARPDRGVGRVLASRVLVGIGLVSYGAYLWHQPILALARIQTLGAISTAALVGLCVLSLLVAGVSWRWIERPFRTSTRLSRRAVFWTGALGTSTMLLLGILGQRATADHDAGSGRGLLSEQWWSAVRVGECHLETRLSAPSDRAAACFERERPSLVIWGDSHAASLYAGSAAVRERGWSITQLTQAGCPPAADLDPAGLLKKPNCNAINDAIITHLADLRPGLVVVHAAWSHDVYPLTSEELAAGLGTMLQRAQNASPESRIVILGPVPRWRVAAPTLLRRLEAQGESSDRSTRAETLPEWDAMLRRVASEVGVEYVSPTARLCDDQGCLLRVPDGGPAYADEQHLSAAGAALLWDDLVAPSPPA